MSKIIVHRDPAKINLAVLDLHAQVGDLAQLPTIAADVNQKAAVVSEAAGQAVAAAGTAAAAELAAVAAQGVAVASATAADGAKGVAEAAAVAAAASAARVDLGALDSAVGATAADRVQTGLDRAAAANQAALAAAEKAAAETARLAAQAAADASIQAGQWDQEVADEAARLALTGLATNWQVYQLDTEHVWRWTGSAWVDRGQSPLALKADRSVVEALPIGLEETRPSNAFEITDAAGNIIFYQDDDGGVFIPDMNDKSIQQAFGDVVQRVNHGAGSRPKNAFEITDTAGNVTAYQDARGAVYIPGLLGPLQGAVGQTLSPETRFPSDRDRLHDLIRPMVADLRVEGLPFIEPPALLVPNRMDVPDGIEDAFRVTPGEGLWLETPYGPGGLVHPFLIEHRKPLLGYRYWMGETPHRNGNAWEENPIIYGTNDFKQFDLLPDFPQPLGFPPGNNTGYNSDIAFTYDPRNGEMIAFWREASGDTITFHYRSTWDGVNWTEIISVTMPTPTRWVSPAILFNPSNSLWHLWEIPGTGSVRHHTSTTPYGPWTLVGTDNISSRLGIDVWHIEVKWLGDRFGILMNDRENLYFGLSHDGTSWSVGGALIEPDPEYAYKGTFIPEFSGDRLRLRVCWNVYAFPIPPGMVPVFHSETTNWIDLSDF